MWFLIQGGMPTIARLVRGREVVVRRTRVEVEFKLSAGHRLGCGSSAPSRRGSETKRLLNLVGHRHIVTCNLPYMIIERTPRRRCRRHHDTPFPLDSGGLPCHPNLQTQRFPRHSESPGLLLQPLTLSLYECCLLLVFLVAFSPLVTANSNLGCTVIQQDA